jgi:GH25 family lysozyme M1 (1,4-beta-N-acetylmuramidase)
MYMEKEEHKKIELKRLTKLKKLIATEIKEVGKNDNDLDMTIVDLEEWQRDVDAEISRKQLKAYIH